MTWTAFWNSIADLFMFCFKIIKSLANIPNAIVWVLIIALLGYWTLNLRKQIKAARQAGTNV